MAPPLPSLAKVSAKYCFGVPVLGSMTVGSIPIVIGQKCLGKPPIAFSGTAFPRANWQASHIGFPTLIWQAPTVAGYFGLQTVPSRAMRCTTFMLPWFLGTD